jgi:hypothetical protein
VNDHRPDSAGGPIARRRANPSLDPRSPLLWLPFKRNLNQKISLQSVPMRQLQLWGLHYRIEISG